MNPEPPDPLMAALATQPTPDVDDWRREHIRLQAQAALREAQARPRNPLFALYRRFVEPASVALVSGGYFAWAVQRVLMIYGG